MTKDEGQWEPELSRGMDYDAITWALRRAVDWLKAAAQGRGHGIENAHEEIMRILRQNGMDYDKDGHLVEIGVIDCG